MYATTQGTKISLHSMLLFVFFYTEATEVPWVMGMAVLLSFLPLFYSPVASLNQPKARFSNKVYLRLL
jgi:hypothetical protein